MPGFAWPTGFDRIPEESWVDADVDALATGYDSVRQHGWYANLGPTVEEWLDTVQDGDIVVDYSGGTGILEAEVLGARPDARFGTIIVDSSRKFLRLALERFRDEERVALRALGYLKPEKRLQNLDEVVGDKLADGGVDMLVSTNAIHLYYGMRDTLASWRRCLRDGATVLVQSGNIGRDEGAAGGWIIDDTVHAIAQAAEEIVREESAFRTYRMVLDDPVRMARYHELRHKYFLPVRPESYYRDRLEGAAIKVEKVRRRTIPARVDEWLDFLSVYHDGILGWVGGVEKIDGRGPTVQDVAARLRLMEGAAHRVFAGKAAFDAEWTYFTGRAA